MKTISDKDINFIEFIGNQESQFITPASEFISKVQQRLNGEGGTLGDSLPWSKTHNCVSLRPGEVSIWAGINGHGKSQLLGMVIAWLTQVSKCLIASLEMKPEATMERMVRQVSGTRIPSDQFTENFMLWTDNRLWIYDQLDSVDAERILGMVHYAAKVLNMNHIVIDSLMKCGISPEDYPKQKEFVDRLCWAAKSLNIHIHLVHHIRKGDKESHIPDKFDIKGAGEITDMVDNVFIVHRNKTKEEQARLGAMVSQEDPDCTLRVSKQRHGEWEGLFKLWFHQDSMQYTPKPENRPLPFPMTELNGNGLKVSGLS